MQCELCDKKATVRHHLTYDNYGNEQPDDLVDLCKSCHFLVHLDNTGKKIPLDNRSLANRFDHYIRLKNSTNTKNIGKYGNIYGQLRIKVEEDKDNKPYITIMRSGRSVYILSDELEHLINELTKVTKSSHHWEGMRAEIY